MGQGHDQARIPERHHRPGRLHLAAFLCEKSYAVHGIKRRALFVVMDLDQALRRE
jgi:hypothetical protein